MQQECEMAYNLAVESYTNSLKKYFTDRNEPFEIPQLFEILKNIRDGSIDEFAIIGEVREKYRDYDDYLNRIQTYINDQEKTIVQINESLAEKSTNKKKSGLGLQPWAEIFAFDWTSPYKFRPEGEIRGSHKTVLRGIRQRGERSLESRSHERIAQETFHQNFRAVPEFELVD